LRARAIGEVKESSEFLAGIDFLADLIEKGLDNPMFAPDEKRLPIATVVLAISVLSWTGCAAPSGSELHTRDGGNEMAVMAAVSRFSELVRKYKGTIDAHAPRGRVALMNAARMDMLMKEWNPIGCEIMDLKSILGQPTRETKEILEYSFDEGRGGILWRFILDPAGETVMGVHRMGGGVKVDPGSCASVTAALTSTRLKSRYGGKISTRAKGRDALEHAARVRHLMKEWNPMGFSASDLRDIMGQPSSETESVLRYSFDQGFNGWAWEFFIGNGVIAGVIVHAID
jgi:hypothetical protein